jgi:hypothetical protein
MSSGWPIPRLCWLIEHESGQRNEIVGVLLREVGEGFSTIREIKKLLVKIELLFYNLVINQQPIIDDID